MISSRSILHWNREVHWIHNKVYSIDQLLGIWCNSNKTEMSTTLIGIAEMSVSTKVLSLPLLWRHNGRGTVSNHQPHHCLLNRLFRSRSKKTPKLRVTGLSAGNSPETGEFPAQMANNAENVFIWWRHHDYSKSHWSNQDPRHRWSFHTLYNVDAQKIALNERAYFQLNLIPIEYTSKNIWHILCTKLLNCVKVFKKRWSGDIWNVVCLTLDFWMNYKSSCNLYFCIWIDNQSYHFIRSMTCGHCISPSGSLYTVY